MPDIDIDLDYGISDESQALAQLLDEQDHSATLNDAFAVMPVT